MPAGFPNEALTFRNYSTWFMIYGVVLVLLGAAAIILPGTATLAIEFLIAWVLLISGGIGIVAAISGGSAAPGFWWNLVSAVIYLVAGLALLMSPAAGAITLTLILAAYLLASGVAKIILSLRYRQTMRSAYGWMLFSGIVDGALGVLIILGLPASGLWILGMLVGVNLVFTGVALLMSTIHARRITTEAGSPGAA